MTFVQPRDKEEGPKRRRCCGRQQTHQQTRGREGRHTAKAQWSQLSAVALKKRCKSRTVVHDVSLTVDSGEVVGFGAERCRQDHPFL